MADLAFLQVLGSAGGGAALGSAARTALSEAGIALSSTQVEALACAEREALAASQRVSFGPGALDALVTEFASSPYVQRENAESLLHELLAAFYELREDNAAHVSDQQIIGELKRAYNGEAAGSVELAASLAADALSAAAMHDELSAYELVDDEGRVYRWGPQEWHDDITAEGWLGERWEDDYE